MNTYLVDTNVLLDVIGADAQFGSGSKDCLARWAGDHRTRPVGDHPRRRGGPADPPG
jgi:hypothetical protein